MRKFRKSQQTAEAKKLEMMRRATSDVVNKLGIGGREKEGGRAPRPITLPKLPWDEEKQA